MLSEKLIAVIMAQYHKYESFKTVKLNHWQGR